MPELATIVLRVANLSRSLSFYVDLIGWTLIDQQPGADLGFARDIDDDVILLAGPAAGDLSPHITAAARTLVPGERMSYIVEEGDQRLATLREGGMTGARVHESAWGDRRVEIDDPDGYILRFLLTPPRTQEQVLALYAATPDELEAALAGLAPGDERLSREPDSWTIAQIANHLADGDALFVLPMRLALTEPGRPFTFNWPQGSGPMAVIDDVPLDRSLAFFRATRSYLTELIRRVPGAWEHTLRGQGERVWRFSELLQIMLRHAHEHIEEIREIRKQQ